jgi:chorismate mutase
VLKHYVTFYNDYGDIIKSTLSKARENNKTNCAKTMVQALITKFHELRDQFPAAIDRNGDEFHSIKVKLESQFGSYSTMCFWFFSRFILVYSFLFWFILVV